MFPPLDPVCPIFLPTLFCTSPSSCCAPKLATSRILSLLFFMRSKGPRVLQDVLLRPLVVYLGVALRSLHQLPFVSPHHHVVSCSYPDTWGHFRMLCAWSAALPSRELWTALVRRLLCLISLDKVALFFWFQLGEIVALWHWVFGFLASLTDDLAASLP